MANIKPLKPFQWCRGKFAKTRTGFGVTPQDPEAVQWCLSGWVNREVYHGRARELKLAHIVSGIIHTANFTDWNDEPGRQEREVISVTKQAAEIYSWQEREATSVTKEVVCDH